MAGEGLPASCFWGSDLDSFSERARVGSWKFCLWVQNAHSTNTNFLPGIPGHDHLFPPLPPSPRELAYTLMRERMRRKGSPCWINTAFPLTSSTSSPPHTPFSPFPDCFCRILFIQQSPLRHYLFFIQWIFLKLKHTMLGTWWCHSSLSLVCPSRGYLWSLGYQLQPKYLIWVAQGLIEFRYVFLLVVCSLPVNWESFWQRLIEVPLNVLCPTDVLEVSVHRIVLIFNSFFSFSIWFSLSGSPWMSCFSGKPSCCITKGQSITTSTRCWG